MGLCTMHEFKWDQCMPLTNAEAMFMYHAQQLCMPLANAEVHMMYAQSVGTARMHRKLAGSCLQKCKTASAAEDNFPANAEAKGLARV